MSLWSGSLALFAMLKVPCAPPPEQSPAASTLPENHDQFTLPLFSGAITSLLTVLSWWLSRWTRINLDFFILLQYCAPKRALHPVHPDTGSSPMTICTGDAFLGGFPGAMTTHSLLLLVRLHFSNCFHTSNFHSTHLKMRAAYTVLVGQVGCCVIPSLTFTTLDCVDYYIKYHTLGAGGSSLVADV